MGKLLVFHQSTNTVPLKYHHRSPGAEENQEHHCVWRCYWNKLWLFPQGPWNKPLALPQGGSAGPIAAGKGTTSSWRGLRRSIEPCMVRWGHHWPQMLGQLAHPNCEPATRFRATTLTCSPTALPHWDRSCLPSPPLANKIF